MREDWARSKPVIDLDEQTVEGLLEPLFPGNRVIEIAPVPGGLTNTNLKIRLAGRTAPLFLRFYQRSGDLAHKEMAICARVKGRVHVPAYLHYAPENPVTGHAFAVIDWIDAKTLQELHGSLNDKALTEIGIAIGAMLAAIHAFDYDHFGFLDAALMANPPMDLNRDALMAYLQKCFVEGLGGPRLGAELTQKLMDFAAREGQCVEAWQDRACLVHGDMNLSNIMVRETASGWEVAALIDWEYAFAGAPGFGLGMLLRPPFDAAATAFIEGLQEGYRGAGGAMPEDWQRIARVTDLFSYADVLHHKDTSADVIADARADISRIISL